MSDINITLDAQPAIVEADRLKKALDKLERRAVQLQKKMNQFLLRGNVTLKFKRFATDMKAMQRLITGYPLYAKVRLSADRRTLGLLKKQTKSITPIKRTSFESLVAKGEIDPTKGKAGGWFASAPDYRKAQTQLKQLATQWGVIDTYEKSTMKTLGGIGALLKGQTASEAKIVAYQKAKNEATRQHNVLMKHKAIISTMKGRDDLGKDYEAFSKMPVHPEADIKRAKRIRTLTDPAELKNIAESEKAYRKYEKIIDRIDKKTPKTVEGTIRKYSDLKDEINAMTMAHRKGGVSNREYNSFLKSSKKDLRLLEKEHRKLNKTVRRGRGFFMNFTMALTAVAATLFIWQKLKQLITTIASKGNELSQTFAKVQAEIGIADARSSMLIKTFEKMSDGKIWGIPQIYEAYKTLRKEGVDAKTALEQTIPTLKIARHENLDLAEAARIAAFNTMGLREQYLRLDKEVSKTAGESWQKLTKSIKDLFAEAFIKSEPFFIDILERLGRFIKENKESIVSGLKEIGETIATMGEFFAWTGLKIASFMGWFEKSAKIDKMKHIEGLEKTLKMQEDLYRSTSKTKDWQFKISGTKKSEVLAGIQKQIENTLKRLDKARRELRELTGFKGIITDEELKLPLPSAEELLAGWQHIYDKTGEMTKRFFDYQSKEVDAATIKYGNMFAAIGDKGAISLTMLANRVAQYNLKWQGLAPYMKEHADYFDTIGKMSDKYYDRLIEKMEKQIDLYHHLLPQEKEELKILKKMAIENKRAEALIRPQAESFEETGIMTDEYANYLKDKAKRAYNAQLKILGDNKEAQENAARALGMKILDIESQRYATSLENEKAFFEATGQRRSGYYDLQIAEYKRAATKMIQQGMNPNDAATMFKELVQAFDDEMFKPLENKWNQYYSKTSKMSEQHIQLEKRSLQRGYENMKSILQNEAAAFEWLTHEATEQHIKILESHDDMCDGIVAGWLRVVEEVDPLSKQISDDVVEGIANIESAWKELFMDTMKGEWNSWLDYTRNILGAFRDMLNEILYDTVKNWIKNTAIFKSIDKMFGGGKDAAEKRAKEALAMQAQNVELTVQAGLVAALTAEYSALAVAMAACGFGAGMGSGSGVFGSGFSASEIADWSTVSSWHKGGRVGVDNTSHRSVPSSMFHGARKLHTGLTSDEYPAILKKHEVVFTPKQLQGMQNVIANDTIKQLSSLQPAAKESSGDINTISINVPVSVDANTRLASRMRTEVEELIHNIMEEEMR